MYDRILTYPRVLKTSVVLAQLACLWLSFRILTGHFDNATASWALAVGGFWMALTTLRLRVLLRTYFDHLSRLQVTIPTTCGVFFAVLALVAGTNSIALTILAVLELCGWLFIYLSYRRNRANYIKQGHGPLPKNAWVSPDHRALQAGDLILTSGRMSGRLHDTVGHAELVIMGDGGRLYSLTSYMETGTAIHRLEAVTGQLVKSNTHFIALRLRQPLNARQKVCAQALAKHYYALNTAWRKETNAKRARFIERLPLPRAAKAWLLAKTRATGYDWSGLFIGTRAPNRWTCIAICVQVLKNLGVGIGDYGTGMLGLGTGLLDPIQPVRLLGDKAYRLVDLDDRARFEASLVS